MPSVNRCIIIGHLGKDPDFRAAPSGTSIVKFSVGVTEKYKQDSHTEWFRVVFFGKQADTINKYVRKGDPIYIEGKLKTSTWADASGQTKYMTELIGDRFQFIGSSGTDRGPSPKQTPQDFDDDSEIPF